MALTPPPDPPAWGRPQPSAGPRRRSMVAGTLGILPLGALTACSDDAGSARADAESRRLRREAARQSRELLARYDATADAHTQLAEKLGPLRAATLRHTEVLDSRRGSEDAKGDPRSGGHDGKQGGPKVPGEAKAALAALGDAERRTAEARTSALLQAPPETARLLASLAAAGAAHAYLLGAEENGGGKGDDGDGKDGGA